MLFNNIRLILLVRFTINLIPFSLRLFLHNLFPFLKLGKFFRHGESQKNYIFKLKELKTKFYLSDSVVIRKIFWEGLLSYEGYLPHIIKKISKNKKVLEIGANFGLYTCIAGKNSKKYYAFEPIEKNFLELRKNINLNQIDKVKIFNLAIVDNNKSKVSLYIPDRDKTEINTGASLLIKSKKYETCNSINIKKILYKIKPNIIKMDIEGYEYNLLLKSKKYILKYKPIIISELNNKKTLNFLINLNPKKIHDINGNVLNINDLKNYRFRDCIFYF